MMSVDMTPADRSMLVKDPRDLVLSRFKHSEDTFKSLFMRCARWYDLYRGATSSGGFQSFRNNISLPMLLSTIWSDVARKQSISFGSWPWVSFFGFGPEDADKARKNELLISAQMKDAQTYLKAVDMFLSADLYGTAIFRYGWRQETERRLSRQMLEAAGKKYEKIATSEREVFNGPNWKVIDIMDFFPQPAVRDIKDMDWVIEREWIEMDELEALSKVEDGAIGEYDRPPVLKLKQSHMLKEIERQMENRRNYIRSPFTQDEARKLEKYAKPVELLHMWGRVPSDFLSEGQAPRRIITLANRQVVIRNRPIPFWIGEIPYGSYNPLRDPHFFHGQGKMEIGERLQLTANRIANQKLDALDLFIDPVFAYDRLKGVDTRNLYMRSGKLVGVDGPPGEALMPIIPNLTQLNEAYGEIEDLWRWLQEGTGIIEGQVSPAPSQGSRTTAREFLSRQEAASTRLLVETRFAEEMWLEPLANAFHGLNQQFLPTPKTLRILGNEALINPVTGEPAAPDVFDVNLEDINNNYDVRARGATLTMSKAARQQNLVLLLQATQSHPVAMQMINWVAFFRDMFRSFEMSNIDELLNPTPAQQQLLQGGPTSPGSTAPAPSEDLLSAMSLPGEQQIGSLEGTLSGQ